MLLGSCGEDICRGSDWTTSQGICVFNNEFQTNKDEVNRIIYKTQEVVRRLYPHKYTRDIFQQIYADTSIIFVEYIDEETIGRTIYDYDSFSQTFRIEIEYGNDLVDVISHEILHSYLLYVDKDQSHRKGWFVMDEFSDEENIDSIQYKICSELHCTAYDFLNR
jgi:hypothetical protein